VVTTVPRVPTVTGVVVYEPLTRTAALSRRLADHHCSGCAWYHGFWPYLRIFGMAASPDRHQDFFLGALGGAATGTGASRVLVSGAADSSMLAHVVEAWRGAGGSAPQVTVLDRCPTPGMVSNWYAQLGGFEISTAVADVVGYTPAEPFDVVCTGLDDDDDGHDRGPEAWAVLRALSVEQMRARIRMRNAQFGFPLPESRIAAIEAGDVVPLAFDYRRAGLEEPGS
jgi:hypothetical protein